MRWMPPPVVWLLLLLLLIAGWLLFIALPASSEGRGELALYPPDMPIDAKLLNLDRQALDDAYHEQLKKLFGVWVSQQARDPERISAGLVIARNAYRQAASQIDKREQQLRK